MPSDELVRHFLRRSFPHRISANCQHRKNPASSQRVQDEYLVSRAQQRRVTAGIRS
jgi:hypothetical protein